MVPGPRFLAKKSAPAPCRGSFPTHMSPERTDWICFRPLRRAELCEACAPPVWGARVKVFFPGTCPFRSQGGAGSPLRNPLTSLRTGGAPPVWGARVNVFFQGTCPWKNELSNKRRSLLFEGDFTRGGPRFLWKSRPAPCAGCIFPGTCPGKIQIGMDSAVCGGRNSARRGRRSGGCGPLGRGRTKIFCLTSGGRYDKICTIIS